MTKASLEGGGLMMLGRLVILWAAGGTCRLEGDSRSKDYIVATESATTYSPQRIPEIRF